MATLSIILPDALAAASQELARRLGMSRTQFIRTAIVHEVENIKSSLEQEAMVNSIKAMKRDKHYLEETEEITEGFSSTLPKDEDEWWNKETS